MSAGRGRHHRAPTGHTGLDVGTAKRHGNRGRAADVADRVTDTRRPGNHNAGIIDEFRRNDGRVGGYFEGAPMILVHHIGARTGTERVSPLVYLPDGDDMIVAATKGGAPAHPDWYHNLKANPRVTAEVGTETFRVEAVEVTGAERDSLWQRLVEQRPGFATYETKTSRVFPMFRLTRLP